MSTSIYKKELEEFKAKVLEEAIRYIQDGYDANCVKDYLDALGLKVPDEDKKIVIEISGFDKMAYSSDYGYDISYDLSDLIADSLDEIRAYCKVFKVQPA